MYKLYLDKPEDFICEVSVKNASLKGSMARLIVESSDGINYVFNGKIENEKCVIPIRRLKGLLDESSKGNMHLEVIVEDTYFKPWKSDFTVEEHTSVKVKINEERQSASTKPIVKVKSPVNNEREVLKEVMADTNVWMPIYEITTLCKKYGIKSSNVRQQKRKLFQLIREYFYSNPVSITHRTAIVNNLKYFLK